MTEERKLRRSYPIRTHLIAFGLILVLPVTVLAGVLFVRSAMLERDQLEARLVQLADDLAENIDRDIERHFTILNTLATLPSLQDADWPTFYSRAKAALQGNGYIILIDSSLRQVVNTYVPYGQAPPLTGDPETAQRMIKSKEREVSDLFVSYVTKGPVFNISVPIIRDGEVRYILSFGRHAADLLDIVRGQRVGPDWVRTIIDRKGMVLARSRDHERVVGTAPAVFAEDLRVVDHSIRRTTNLDGEAVLRALARSRVSGWLITVNVPLAVAQVPLERSAAFWGLTGAAALLLTLALAFVFADRISKPMMQAAESARALGREEPVLALNSSISEANAIMLAIQHASAELRERLAQQRLLARELNHRVKNVLAMVQAMVRRTVSDERPVPQARELIGQRLQALARAQDLLLRMDWKDVSIKEIIATELAPYSDRIVLDGPDLRIDGRNAQTLTLLLHELTTNAVKYGALSEAMGEVSISWSITGGDAHARFWFRWQERRGPPIKSPVHKGFGSVLLESTFSGPDTKRRLAFEPGGLVYELDVPLATLNPSQAQTANMTL
jgi:two-component sensor histidine kinase